MITQVITFYGTVQGVGFRPTTARLAERFGISGQVRNMGSLVELMVTDTPDRIDEFVELISKNSPRSADILSIERRTIDTVTFDGFSIVSSAPVKDEISMVPADIAICERCLEEYNDPQNRRYLHPYISCADCGPRFTIMERLPYDRETTSMRDFDMCEDCEEEYTRHEDIRYHAQTISCFDCGPQPIWRKSQLSGGLTIKTTKNEIPMGRSFATDAMDKAVSALNEGSVVAIKGVGGYYLACRVDNENAVAAIRKIKIREEKPFAVMFANIDEVNEYCDMTKDDEELLTSLKRPIVLIERKRRIPNTTDQNGIARENETIDFAPGVCNNSRFVGAFLPSMGLQYYLIDRCGPLVMTSANLSNLPIITSDEEMAILADREPMIAGMLYNTRRIVTPADDSVARVIDGKPQLIRRAKGYTPAAVYMRGAPNVSGNMQIFATGGQLKSSFSLSKGSYSYPSQCFGDMDSMEAEKVYITAFERLKQAFDIDPLIAVCDMHPNYFTTEFAERLCVDEERLTGPLKVQHHHAHIASVMSEHGLAGPVIGVAFDGTGFGTDGNIWGGEVLICKEDSFLRFSHLKYVSMIGGDSSMKQGWKSALSYLYAYDTAYKHTVTDDVTEDANGMLKSEDFEIDLTDIMSYCKENKTLAEFEKDAASTAEHVMAALAAGTTSGASIIESSSMGRLFDAVASLLGIHHVNRYEGECAIMLENAAARALAGTSKSKADDIALSFHKNVAETILLQCTRARSTVGSNIVCLSGGVFQNRVLTELTLALLREHDFDVRYNIAVPPNDGGIALGQNYIGLYAVVNGKI